MCPSCVDLAGTPADESSGSTFIESFFEGPDEGIALPLCLTLQISHVLLSSTTSQSVHPLVLPPHGYSQMKATSLTTLAPMFLSLTCAFQSAILQSQRKFPPSVPYFGIFFSLSGPLAGLASSHTSVVLVQVGQCLLKHLSHTMDSFWPYLCLSLFVSILTALLELPAYHLLLVM